MALRTNCSGVGENNDSRRIAESFVATKPGHNVWIITPWDAHSAANDLNKTKRKSKENEFQMKNLPRK